MADSGVEESPGGAQNESPVGLDLFKSLKERSQKRKQLLAQQVTRFYIFILFANMFGDKLFQVPKLKSTDCDSQCDCTRTRCRPYHRIGIVYWHSQGVYRGRPPVICLAVLVGGRLTRRQAGEAPIFKHLRCGPTPLVCSQCC